MARRSPRRSVAALIAVVLVSLALAATLPSHPLEPSAPLAASVLTADDIPLSDIAPWELAVPYPLPAARVTIPIHIVFLGVPDSLVDTDVLAANLLPSYEPIATAPLASGQDLVRYATYSFAYSIDIAPDATANAYAAWLEANHRTATAPWWIQELPAFPANAVAHVDAPAALDWLEGNLAPYAEDGYTIVIVDAYHTSPSVAYSKYYFYESVTLDVDTGFPHLSRWSSYMTGFGGGPGRMIFLDLSAGPTNSGHKEGIAVNATTMPPVWTYGIYESARFSADVALYVDYAIMQRFVPSYFTPPRLHATYEVQAILFNDDPSRSFLPYVDLDAILTAYGDLNPFSTFTGSIVEVPLSNDPVLEAFVRSATDPVTGQVDDEALKDFFKANLDAYVAPSQASIVIPMILFGFPGRTGFASGASGWASSIQGESAFILAVANEELLGELPRTVTKAADGVTWASESFTLAPGGSAFFSGGAMNAARAVRAPATGASWLNGTFDVTSGSVDFYLFTEYEWRNLTTWGGGDPLIAGWDLSGSGWWFSLAVQAPGYYYAVFVESVFAMSSMGPVPAAAVIGGASVTFAATLEAYYGEGFTQVLVHEGGHFFGLHHPHDGALWLNGEPFPYQHWFFDFGPSSMSYLTGTYGFDRFDKDAVLRGNALVLMSEALAGMWVTWQLMLQEQVRLIPWNVMDHLNESARAVLFAKVYLEANGYDEAVAWSLLAQRPAREAMATLLADLEAVPVLTATLSPDRVAPNHEVRATGRVHSIRNFTLEFVVGGTAYPMAYEASGGYEFLARGLPWGVHAIDVRMTDAAGTVLKETFVVEVPIDLWIWITIGAAIAAAALLGILLVLRRRKRRPEAPAVPAAPVAPANPAPPMVSEPAPPPPPEEAVWPAEFDQDFDDLEPPSG